MNTNSLKQLLEDKLSKLTDEERMEIKNSFSKAIKLQETAHQLLINSVRLAIDCGINRETIITILDNELASNVLRS